MFSWMTTRALLVAVVRRLAVFLRLVERPLPELPPQVPELVRLLQQARSQRQVLELVQLQALFLLDRTARLTVARAVTQALQRLGDSSLRNSKSKTPRANSTARRQRAK